MRKKTVGLISMISILLSPLLGGLVGKYVVNLNILDLYAMWMDDIVCYIGMMAWIIASVIFYISFSTDNKNDNPSNKNNII